jgi:hypothetical protein
MITSARTPWRLAHGPRLLIAINGVVTGCDLALGTRPSEGS